MSLRKRLMRASTEDRGPPAPDGGHIIHTVEQLGPNMRKLPNGSLLCLNVPLARTGWMMYGPDETPITANEHGVAFVERTNDSLFQDDTMGSIIGAAVVDEHPADFVTPKDWRSLAHGTCLRAWRGTGEDSDLIMGDLLITSQELIDSVMAGKREISLGYDADYTATGDGVGLQSGIIVNHIALVKKGRCGPRCAIGDREYQLEKEEAMANQQTVQQPRRRAVLDKAISAAVEDAMKELGDEGEGATHIHIHNGKGGSDDDGDEGNGAAKEDPYEKRFEAVEASLKTVGEAITGLSDMVTKLVGAKPAKTGDDDTLTDEQKAAALLAQKTNDAALSDDDEGKGTPKDSAALETGYTRVLAQAEILVPGFRMPTFDAALPRKQTVDSMCIMRRKALDIAYATKDGATLIDSVSGDAGGTLDLAGRSCKDIAVLFNAASALRASMNNKSATKDAGFNASEQPLQVGAKSIADMNKAAAEFWSKNAVSA